MPIALDVLCLVLLAVMAFRGYRRGLVASVLGAGRFFIAIILTVALTSPVAGLLNDHLINPPVYGYVNGRLVALADKTEGSAAELLESMPEILSNQLGDNVSAEGRLDTLVEEWSETISQSISGAVSSVIATVLLFVLFMLLLSLSIKLIAGLIHATPLASVDRILGLVLGLITGLGISVLAARLLTPALTALGKEAWVEASRLLSWLG